VPGVRGYDAGQQVNGRQRHILVDTLGLLLTVVVTIASVQDRDGARWLLGHRPGGGKQRRKIWVDGGYAGHLVDWVAARFAFCLAVVLRPKERKGFVLLPRRWVVERTCGWLNHARRLSKRYERLTRTDESWVYLAMTRLMLERLAQAGSFQTASQASSVLCSTASTRLFRFHFPALDRGLDVLDIQMAILGDCLNRPAGGQILFKYSGCEPLLLNTVNPLRASWRCHVKFSIKVVLGDSPASPITKIWARSQPDSIRTKPTGDSISRPPV
jgi:transposase